jgi:hypothetical protein
MRSAMTTAMTRTTSSAAMTSNRRTTMYAMQQALARERMHDRELDAVRHRLTGEFRAAARWRSVESRATRVAQWAEHRRTVRGDRAALVAAD